MGSVTINVAALLFEVLLVLSSATLLVPSSSVYTSAFSIVHNKYKACSRTTGFIDDISIRTPLSSHSKSQSQSQPCLWTSSTSLNASPLSSSAVNIDTKKQKELKDLFSKFSNEDGFLSKETLESMPPFSEMLADGDLLPEELADVWDAAAGNGEKKDLIGFDSFLQVYRDIDDMFEDDDVDDDVDNDDEEERDMDGGDGDDDEFAGEMDSELVQAFESLSNDEGLVSRDDLRSWDEVATLFKDGLLGEDEFDSLWAQVPKSASGAQDNFIDSDGFLAFNFALDDLFDFDEDELSEDDVDSAEIDSIVEEATSEKTSPTPRAMVEEGDLPPGVLFANLADENQLVGMEELGLWIELQEMLKEGDLLQSELQDIYDRSASSGSKLDEEAFLRLYDEIDSLFEEESDDETVESDMNPAQRDPVTDQADQVKKDLMAFLDIIQEDEDSNLLPCGLEATESDQKQVNNIVKALESQPSNMIKEKQGNIEMADLTGSWELLYSSSSAMKFNKGLSGLGGSFPNGRFAGLKQKLIATKVIQDMEYIERIEVTPSTASFDVSVPGNWQIKKSVSLFTGETTNVIQLEPERVNYGPTSMRADHWKSLGPMNMLDLTYLDDDLRVMRGCTSSDTIFIWKRIREDR